MANDAEKVITNSNNLHKRLNRLRSGTSDKANSSLKKNEATNIKLSTNNTNNNREKSDLNKRRNVKAKTYNDKTSWIILIFILSIFASLTVFFQLYNIFFGKKVSTYPLATMNRDKDDENDYIDTYRCPEIITNPHLDSNTIKNEKTKLRPRVFLMDTCKSVQICKDDSTQTCTAFNSKIVNTDSLGKSQRDQSKKNGNYAFGVGLDGPKKANKSHKTVIQLQKPKAGIDDTCVFQYSWQNSSYPLTCNTVHEVNVRSLFYDNFIANGYYRDVWKIPPTNNIDIYPSVIKTIRMTLNLSDKLLDKQRVDAVIMEQLSDSQHVLPIYGYCGYSGLFPFSEKGDLESTYTKLTIEERFQTAINVASAIADMHYCGANKNLPVIAHADITAKQFLHFNGQYVLNDFNRARLLKWNSKIKIKKDRSVNETCTFQIKVNKGKNRSPEEYKVGHLTEKIDVYSMGNIFYRLIENKASFAEFSNEEVYAMVKQGIRPIVSEKTRREGGPKIQTLIKAMNMCFIQESKSRPSAKEILTVLLKAQNKFENNL